MSEGLVGDKRRQATAAIRGYVYQAYQSVLAWIRLGNDEVLFLEGAEDFDVHSAEGVTATQVKNTAGSGTLTLRSGDAVAAINNLWRHQQTNPDKVVNLRFLTTASPGREKEAEFGDIATGIEYWALAKRDEGLSLEPLKSFLLSLELAPPLADLLRRSDDRAILYARTSFAALTGIRDANPLMALLQISKIAWFSLEPAKGLTAISQRKSLILCYGA